MNIGDFLQAATAELKKAGVESARLDCLILLEDTLELNRAAILAHPETKLGTTQIDILNKKIVQRTKHTPLAYIRGKAPFYGRKFFVDDHVLVPRPETETMIELLKEYSYKTRLKRIVDVGTGSGCIGITAALETGANVGLYDIDSQALDVARRNAETFGVVIQSGLSDLLDNVPPDSYDAILANLPYVPENYPINEAAGHEPRLAIFAGKDGLELYRRLWSQVIRSPSKPPLVLTESLLLQHSKMVELARDAGYELSRSKGLIQQFER
ncbi:MAG TPA: HemK/PrmC family methyltransferase [Patescibacteria group bacterium]|nr:HemK/PrmC family methyltransferase [Patescibacteria group bacterium]